MPEQTEGVSGGGRRRPEDVNDTFVGLTALGQVGFG